MGEVVNAEAQIILNSNPTDHGVSELFLIGEQVGRAP